MDTANTFIFGSIILVIIVAGVFAFFAKKDGDSTSVETNHNNSMTTSSTTATTEGLLAEKAVFKTNRGDIEIEFYDFAPVTANNFITLAQDGFYDGTRFHRVIENFMVQGGDPLSADISAKARWGTGGPGYTIQDEFTEGMTNRTGTIAMANTGQPNSGGSQFFINVADNTNLDYDKQPLSSKHPVFGSVTKGMDIVVAISQVDKDTADRPLEDVIIESIEIK